MMGIEYMRLTNFSSQFSSKISEIPTWAWWAVGIGAVCLVLWTTKR